MSSMRMRLGAVTVIALCGMSLLFGNGLLLRKGTSILHCFLRAPLAPVTETITATGWVQLRQNQQGGANNQGLQVAAAGLEANTTYLILVRFGLEPELTYVASAETDDSGAFWVKYRRVGNGNGLGVNHYPMPEVLNPVSRVSELVVATVNREAVLVADLTAPDTLQYLVKRNLTNDGLDADARGALHLHATTSESQFRLRADGLNPLTEYYLALNGEIAGTSSTDSTGCMRVTNWLVQASEVLQVRHLAILDGTGQSLLSTSLPKATIVP